MGSLPLVPSGKPLMDSRLPEKSEQRYQTCWLGGDEEEGTLGFAPALPQQTVTLDHPCEPQLSDQMDTL